MRTQVFPSDVIMTEGVPCDLNSGNEQISKQLLFPHTLLALASYLLMLKLVWVLFLLLAKSWTGSSKYVKGHIRTSSRWAFVTRFVFLNEAGKLNYKVAYPVTHQCCPSLVFYDDDYWSDVYPSPHMDCPSKVNFASKYYGNNLPYKLESTNNANCVDYPENGINFRRCSGELLFHAFRSRWWYLVFSHCELNKSLSLDVKYEFIITNGESWDKHISADKADIAQITLLCLILFTLLFIIGLVFTRHLMALNFLHYPYKLFMISLGYEELALVLEAIYYFEYVLSGNDDMSLQTSGALFHALSETMFIILTLVIAKGFTTTRGKLSSFDQIKITSFALTYAVVYIVVFVLKTESYIRYPGLVQNDFDNFAGRTIVSLRLSAWVWFIYTTVCTVFSYPEKKAFYCWFCTLFTVWFLLKPSFIIWSYMISNEQTNRIKIIKSVDLSICAIAYMTFLYLTRPTQANKNFPFHVRTNQVDVMTEIETENFPHTEEYSKLGKRSQGWLEASLTELERVEDKNKTRDGVSSAWFSRKA